MLLTDFKLSFNSTVFLCCSVCFLFILIYIIFGRKYLDPRPRILFLLSLINLLLIAFYVGGLKLLYYILGSRGVVRYSFLLSLGEFKTNIYINSQELLPQTYFLSILVYILIFILIIGSFYFLVRLYRKNEINWTFWLRFYLCLYTLSIFILVYFIALFQYFLCLP
jgi:hypothetical protein